MTAAARQRWPGLAFLVLLAAGSCSNSPQGGSTGQPQTRQALKGLIQRAKAKKEPSFIFVNNRLEGNAPSTIEAIVQED